MNTKSYHQFDRPYRRGLVLGLSLAELFLILLFLLLLISFGISSSLKEQVSDLEQQKKALVDGLKAVKDAVGSDITDANLEDLVKDLGKASETKKLNDKLKDDLRVKEDQVHNLTKENKELQNEIQDLQNKSNELNETLSASQEQLATTERMLDNIKKKPGDVPPCWLVEVPSSEGLRAKHLKIYNIKIKDLTMTVRLHPFPYPDNANFGNKFGLPVIDKKFFHTELTPEQFVQAFQGVRDAGENRLIQNYACRFMVDVYDQTSSINKKGFKSQLKVVEGLFYTFEEEKLPWDKMD